MIHTLNFQIFVGTSGDEQKTIPSKRGHIKLYVIRFIPYAIKQELFWGTSFEASDFQRVLCFI